MLMSIKTASEGKNVIFVSNTLPHADLAKMYIYNFVNNIECVVYYHNKITFESGCNIEIMTEKVS